jgi:hypothetical protein
MFPFARLLRTFTAPHLGYESARRPDTVSWTHLRESTARSQAVVWFQLAKMRVTRIGEVRGRASAGPPGLLVVGLGKETADTHPLAHSTSSIR